jgi:hypothetical protein
MDEWPAISITARINCGGFESKNHPDSQGARPFAKAKSLKARFAVKKSKNPLRRGARVGKGHISRDLSG